MKLVWNLGCLVIFFNISISVNCIEEQTSSSNYFRQHHKLDENATYQHFSTSLQQSEACLKDEDCPLWSYCDESTGSCKCLQVSAARFRCTELEQVEVMECSCATYHKGSIQIGYCIYSCVQRKMNSYYYYYALSPDTSNWDNDTCGKYHRNETLCGKCAHDYYPRAYSFDLSCMECHNKGSNWWLYVVAAFLPLTFFYFTILLLHINVHSSHLQGFALYCQLITTPIFIRNLYLYIHDKPLLLIPVQLFGSLYGIWNLDFFRMYDLGICLRMDTLSTLALDLAVAVYPLLLMTLTYTLIHLYDRKVRVLVVLWKPFRWFFYLFKENWDIRTSTVDAFATFMFLSNVKFLAVCFDLLIPVRVDKFSRLPEGNFKHSFHWRLYYDATIPYFGDEHVRYAYLAFLILLFFVFFPIIMLILYPFKVCQMGLNLLPRRLQIVLRTFMDSFQGCYRDGTKPGCKDYRWFSSLPFLVRLILFTIYACTLNPIGFPLSGVVLVLSAIAVINLEPYKRELSHFSDQLVVFILCLTSFVVCIVGGSLVVTTHTIRSFNFFLFGFFIVLLGIIPLLYISVHIFIWMVQNRKFGFEFVSRLKARRIRYFEGTL